MKPARAAVGLAVGVLAISWGAPLARLTEAAPLAVAMWRMLLATALLAPVTTFRGGWAPVRRNGRQVALAGLLLGLHFGLWIPSLWLTTVSASVVLVATQPLFVLLLSPSFLGVAIRPVNLASFVLALCGVLVISWGDFHLSTAALLGDLLALGGAVAGAGYLVVGKRLRQEVPLSRYLTVVYGGAALVLAVAVASLRVAPLPPRHGLLVAIAGVSGGPDPDRPHPAQLGAGAPGGVQGQPRRAPRAGAGIALGMAGACRAAPRPRGPGGSPDPGSPGPRVPFAARTEDRRTGWLKGECVLPPSPGLRLVPVAGPPGKAEPSNADARAGWRRCCASIPVPRRAAGRSHATGPVARCARSDQGARTHRGGDRRTRRRREGPLPGGHSDPGRARLPILTDVHEPAQAEAAAEIVDVLQVPAFLCRQTDLLLACGRTGKPVNIKKGQFMAPHDMGNVVAKVHSTGNRNVTLTERGSSFGYNNLVVDLRGLAIMRRFAPVVFDVTHSLQLPGGLGHATGGAKEFFLTLARGAVAAGCDALFVEVHDDPPRALSDPATQLSGDEFTTLLRHVQAVRRAVEELTGRG